MMRCVEASAFTLTEVTSRISPNSQHNLVPCCRIATTYQNARWPISKLKLCSEYCTEMSNLDMIRISEGIRCPKPLKLFV